jgi:acetyltransferase-like isoleucine patch superfamily enzyme/dTDP-4-dehydrorhamnose 3,5-epimerase-like enzyme
MSFKVDESSQVFSQHIGDRTSIWQFVVILERARIGSDCNICSHVFIENEVVIGNNVTIKSGVQIWDGVTLEDEVFVGPNVSFSNDKFPRSKKHQKKVLETVIRRGASISSGAIILPGIEVGENAMIGAGAVVTNNVPANAIVKGNPGRITGYVDSSPIELTEILGNNDEDFPNSITKITGVQVVRLKTFSDIRGNISVANIKEEIPFEPKRFYTIFGVPSKETRGQFALKTCHQFLTCVKGTCQIMLDDGKKRQEVILNSPSVGLYIPPKVWATQYKYSEDALLTVFASEKYDPNDYIRNYSDFLKIV